MRAWFVSLALFALDRGASTPVFTVIDLHTGRLFFKRCRKVEAIVAFVRRSSNRIANLTTLTFTTTIDMLFQRVDIRVNGSTWLRFCLPSDCGPL